MEYNSTCKIYGIFYHKACIKELKKRKLGNKDLYKEIKKEYIQTILRAKDIGKSKLISAYCMAAYFISFTRVSKLEPDLCYEIFEAGLRANFIFQHAMGNANSYLDIKKLPGRKEWSRVSHLKEYENDWVVDIIEKTDTFELGYNYLECGVCKLCKDENCFELAKYLCKLDFVMADLMGMKLDRTMTIADGDPICDFRYNRKEK